MTSRKFLIVMTVLALAGAARASVISDLAGPSDYGYATPAASYSLSGLTVGDTRQGQVADCWFWSTLASIIHHRPDTLAQNYAVQTDGTVDVTFFRGGSPITYNVTAAINTWWGDPSTGYDDSNGDAAGQIMQKAFAAFRTPAGMIANLGWGTPAEAISAFGWTSSTLPTSIAAITTAFLAGDIVNIDTGWYAPPGMVVDHSYSVWAVNPGAGTVTLRSPWGDGYAGFNEYVTVDQSALASFSVGVWAGLPGGASPVPVPEPGTWTLMAVGVALLFRRSTHRH